MPAPPVADPALESVPEPPADAVATPVEPEPQVTSRRRWVGRILLGAGVLILLIVGWVGFRAVQAYLALSSARDVVEQMESEFHGHGISRPDHLTALADRLAHEAASARSAVDDPLYRAATVVPWVGDNLAAAGQLARAVDAVAAEMPAAARLTPLLDGAHLLPHGGAMDMSVVEAGSKVMVDMNAAVQRAGVLVDSIDRRKLIGPIDSAVVQFQAQLPQVSTMTQTGARLATLAAPMLGSESPRTYLLVFQNLAEPRATGGIFGSYAALRIDNGRLSIVDQGSGSRDIGTFDAPVGAVDAASRSLYSERIGTFPMDVNFTPQFPAAASRFAQMYTRRTKQPVDGVIAIDPVVISKLLVAREPIELGDGGKLDAANVIQVLLSDVYARYPHGSDAPARDTYLNAATAAAFQAMISGGGDLRVTVSNTKDMVDERRVMVWSAHPAEQTVLLDTQVAGVLPVDPPTRPSVGVFLNDGSGSKLGYYLDGAATLAPGECTADGSRQLQLTVTLTDSSPSSGLSPYVIGGNNPGYRLGLNALIFAPTGGSVSDIKIDGAAAPALAGTDGGRSVLATTVDLGPGSLGHGHRDRDGAVRRRCVRDPLVDHYARGPSVDEARRVVPVVRQFLNTALLDCARRTAERVV